MSRRSTKPPAARDSLSVKLGAWFEAEATGWGVVAAVAALGMALAAAALQLLAG